MPLGLGRAQHLKQRIGTGRKADYLRGLVIRVVAIFVVMCVDVALDIFGRRMAAAFCDFPFENLDGVRRLSGCDYATFYVFVQQVQDALGVFFVHQHFGRCF